MKEINIIAYLNMFLGLYISLNGHEIVGCAIIAIGAVIYEND